MSTHAATRLAWSLAGLSAAISVARIALYVLARSPPSPHLHHVQGARSDDCSKAIRGDSFHELNLRGGSS
jgi:hypothetical protein